MSEKYRLITRSDFDGLVCAILLKELDMIEDIKFVHPKDMQDGTIEVSNRDITTNLPYNPNAYLSFDHHESEAIRNISASSASNFILDPHAPSAARVVYNHFGGVKRFSEIDNEMMRAVDKADSARFTMEDVLHPKGWELISFLMDARTGLGRFRSFRISNYALMMDLIAYCRDHGIDEILDLPDVKERVELYFHYEKEFKDQLERCSTVFGNLVILDLREEDVIFPGNRFMIYALHPSCNISIHLLWGLRKQNTVFATGKSIFDKTSKTDIGKLMLEYGGGGHEAAGTCQIANDKAEAVRLELIARINKDG